MANGELDIIKQLIAFSKDPEGKDEKTFDILMATSQASVLESIIKIRERQSYIEKYSIGVRMVENKGWTAIVLSATVILFLSFTQPEIRTPMLAAIKAILDLLG